MIECNFCIIKSFIFPILCVFLIYFTNTSKTNFILVILKSKPLTFLGKISYGIYMIHYPLVYFYKAVIANPKLPGEGYWEFIDLLRLRTTVEDAGLAVGSIENVPISF